MAGRGDRSGAGEAFALALTQGALGVREAPRQAAGGLARTPKASRVAALEIVQVRSDGGSGGDLTTPPSWTYSIWTMNADPAVDDPLAEDVEVVYRRRANGACGVALDDTLALAQQTSTGWVILMAYDEYELGTAC